MGSPRFSLNGLWGSDVKSALRHTVAPILAGAALAGWEVVQKGVEAGVWAVDLHQVAAAAKLAAIAGVGRLVQQYFAEGTT